MKHDRAYTQARTISGDTLFASFLITATLLLSVFLMPGKAFACPPTPTCTISPSSANIVTGSSTTLTWSSTNCSTTPTQPSINNGVGNVACSGSTSVSPASTLTYTLTVKNSCNTANTCNTTVNVMSCSMSVSPSPITTGGLSTLTWSSVNASSASIDQGIGSVGTSGSTSVLPSTSTTYTGTFTGTAGTVRCSTTLTTNNGIVLTGNVKFLQNLAITGALLKSSGTFVIDDPLDPANKLLFHSFVESPDVKNIYDGIATLDGNGETTVQLPDYFDALNKDVRYQFFPLGQSMPNLYVKEEEHDNHFTIAGGVAGGTISWQITGIRHDPYILLHPIIPEVMKSANTIVPPGECIYKPLCQ